MMYFIIFCLKLDLTFSIIYTVFLFSDSHVQSPSAAKNFQETINLPTYTRYLKDKRNHSLLGLGFAPWNLNVIFDIYTSVSPIPCLSSSSTTCLMCN